MGLVVLIDRQGLALGSSRKVLKASEHQALVSAQEILALARTQADAIRVAGERDAEQARERGYRDGRERAQRELAERLVRIQADAARTYESLKTRIADAAARAAASVLRAAERRLFFEAALAAATVAVSEATFVTLKTHPSECELVRAQAELWRASLPNVKFFSVEVDPVLKPGACVLETDCGVVDASLETQIAALAQAFNQALSAAGLDQNDEDMRPTVMSNALSESAFVAALGEADASRGDG